MHGILAGKWLLSFDWVLSCLRNNKKMLEPAFEVQRTPHDQQAQSGAMVHLHANAFPESIGVVGVGTIGSAVVRGLLGAPAGHLSRVPSFVLYDTNATKASALKAEFPQANVSVAASDQEVVSKVACVILALPGKVAEPVIKTLNFPQGQHVISLIAAIKLPDLQKLIGKGVDTAIAVPLPAIAKRQGATLGIPPNAVAEAIFSLMGSYIAVTDVDQFVRMSAACAFMGDFYKRQLTIQQWLGSHGVETDKAASYLGAVFATFAADSKDAGPTTFAEKVAEQTPGGLNEMVWKQQEADGVYVDMGKSLDAVYARDNGNTGIAFPNMKGK
jgi:pyrroline-5-carboxylate reductase